MDHPVLIDQETRELQCKKMEGMFLSHHVTTADFVLIQLLMFYDKFLSILICKITYVQSARVRHYNDLYILHYYDIMYIELLLRAGML